MRCVKSEYFALVELTSTIASAPVVALRAGRAPSSVRIISDQHAPNKLRRRVDRVFPWTMVMEQITPSEERLLGTVVGYSFCVVKSLESPLCLAQKRAVVQNERSEI